MWYVFGGVYEDFKFESFKVKDNLLVAPSEHYGPFDTYEEAYDVWKAKAWLNVDNALHKLEILKTRD